MLIQRLPDSLEDAEELLRRRASAVTRKNLWQSLYREAYEYAMPARETFSWRAEGQHTQRQLFDSTLQETTYTAANTLHALLFPSWTRWAELAPGGAIPQKALTPEIVGGLQEATKTFFDFLNTSNFSTVIGECALDLMVGTCGLSFTEGDADQPFKFTSIPLSAIEIEEGPDGTVETTWMCRKPKARDLLRLYPGMELFDLSETAQKMILETPDKEIEVIQGEVYHPETKKYFGVVLEVAARHIAWRFDYGVSCPTIVARATKTAGETYGRGRVLLALPDAKTLNRMVEFTLEQAALQIAPPMTGVSDGVLNPYTATLAPKTIIPVASNDSGNPSLQPLELGGNFNITQAHLEQKRESVRRTMLGPEPSEGAIKSATEISIGDRNRLWAMGGEFHRVEAELLFKIVLRGVFILQKKGLMPKFKIDGRAVVVKFTSPFSKSQADTDLIDLQSAIGVAAAMGPENVQLGIKVEEIPAYVFRLKGIPEKLIRSDEEVAELKEKLAQAASAVVDAQATESGREGAGVGALLQ